MAKARSGLSSAAISPTSFQMQIQPPQMASTTQQAQQQNAATFSANDNSPFHELYNGRQYFQSQNLTADQVNATIQYLDNRAEKGTMYSMSQNMNQLMMQNAINDKSLTDGMNANQMYTYRHLMASMHNLGHNMTLTRYDHGEFVNSILEKTGVKNADFSKMSETQLRSMLVGRKYGEERFVSTSYNRFRNAPQNSKDTFVNRAIRIEYHAKASAQGMMPGNGPGGSLGEIVLKPSGGTQNYHITGVHVDHNVGVRKKRTAHVNSSIHQIVIEVDVD